MWESSFYLIGAGSRSFPRKDTPAHRGLQTEMELSSKVVSLTKVKDIDKKKKEVAFLGSVLTQVWALGRGGGSSPGAGWEGRALSSRPSRTRAPCASHLHGHYLLS